MTKIDDDTSVENGYIDANKIYTCGHEKCNCLSEERRNGLEDFLTDILEKRQPCEIWSRVMGYYRPTTCWNKGKQQEHKDRQSKTFKEPTEASLMDEINVF